MRNTQGWGQYIQRLRRATGLSRPELARRLGVNPATVWRWETQGARPESPDIPEAVAALFQLDVDEVLAAAGLRPGIGAPAEPTVEVDEEVLLILNSDLSPRRKTQMIARLHELREQDRARREQTIRWMIDEDRGA